MEKQELSPVVAGIPIATVLFVTGNFQSSSARTADPEPSFMLLKSRLSNV
jgi:hypothetical protein